jgi:hypothetical protein
LTANIGTAGDDWNAIYTMYGMTAKAIDFDEANAETVELRLTNGGSWYYLSNFSWFYDKYNSAMGFYGGCYTTDAGAPKAAAKRILQGVYERIPFIEMKRSDYDWSVRAPD